LVDSSLSDFGPDCHFSPPLTNRQPSRALRHLADRSSDWMTGKRRFRTVGSSRRILAEDRICWIER
jgi:hypothetical protein